MNRWNAECTESTDASFKEGPCPELWETETRLSQVWKDLESRVSSKCQDEKEEKDASKDPDPNQKMQQPQDR